jgi:serine/threonine-protein kinase
MSANDEDTRLLSVAQSISDGAPVDWADVERELAGPEQSAIVDELKALETLARVHEEVPTGWGPFIITGEIARGAFGTVYRAIDPALQVEVALKVIRPRNPEAQIDPDKALQEARLLASVSHTNVVRVYRVERIGSEVGLAMEFVKGQTLDELVKRHGPLSANEAIVIGLDLCRALAAVHGARKLHGDIKAHNVMRGEGGRTVLMDFGAGREIDSRQLPPGLDFAGTPLYLAPEVFAQRGRSKASDIYSLGVLLFFLVSGSYPVTGATRTEVGLKHTVPTFRRRLRDVRPDLPDGFIRVVDRALAERPDDRYQSAGAFEADLARTLSQAPPVPIPFNWRRALITAAALLAVGVTGVGLYNLLDWSTSGAYRIDAALYREQNGVETLLRPGERVAPGDRLFMMVRSSVPAHVYIVNEDEDGQSFLLFPLPGRLPENPLPPGERHRLPGTQDGQQYYWQVTSPGKREHFLIVASPERSAAFERMFASLPRPRFDQPIVQSAKLSTDQMLVLRAVGGLTTAPVVDRQLRLYPEFAVPLTGSEETARGVWVRQVTLENP